MLMRASYVTEMMRPGASAPQAATLVSAEISGDIPVSIGGDTIISGPAFDANGNPIPTPQTLGGLSNGGNYPVHRFQPVTSALSPAPVHPRLSAPPPRQRAGSAKGLLRAQQVVVDNVASVRPREGLPVQRERLARVLQADPAEAGVAAQSTAVGSLAAGIPGAEATTAAVGGDAAAADPAPAASGVGEAAAEALPVVEAQPISVQEQDPPANLPTGLAAGALPDVDGNPADESGPAGAAAALHGALPEPAALAQATVATTEDPAGQQAAGEAQPEAVPESGAVAADGAADDAGGGGAGQGAAESVATAGVQAAGAVEPAVGASAADTAEQAAPPSPQDQASYMMPTRIWLVTRACTKGGDMVVGSACAALTFFQHAACHIIFVKAAVRKPVSVLSVRSFRTRHAFGCSCPPKTAMPHSR